MATAPPQQAARPLLDLSFPSPPLRGCPPPLRTLILGMYGKCTCITRDDTQSHLTKDHLCRTHIMCTNTCMATGYCLVVPLRAPQFFYSTVQIPTLHAQMSRTNTTRVQPTKNYVRGFQQKKIQKIESPPQEEISATDPKIGCGAYGGSVSCVRQHMPVSKTHTMHISTHIFDRRRREIPLPQSRGSRTR